MVTTSTQNTKYNRLFDLFDIDGSGSVSRADYQLMEDRILEMFGIEPQSPKGRALHSEYDRAWSTISNADSDGDGQVTREEFIAAIESYANDTSIFEETSDPIVSAEFAAADKDDDGILYKAEFTRLIRALGASAPDAEAAFARMDTSHDDRVSLQEYLAAWREFCNSSDLNAGGSWLLGKPR